LFAPVEVEFIELILYLNSSGIDKTY